MLIEEKLMLSKSHQKIAFISEGLFYNLYNQSAYIVTELLGCKLRVKGKRIKKLNNRAIIVTGFPKKNMQDYFPEAVATESGFVLHGNWDLSGYAEWLARHVAQVACNVEHDDTHNYQNNYQSEFSLFNPIDETVSMADRVYLTPQQEAFIEAWENGKYLIHVDMGFLENLKFHLLAIKNQNKKT